MPESTKTDCASWLIQAARCAHQSATGGNDYHLCNDCGLSWDYRRETAEDALRREINTAISGTGWYPIKADPLLSEAERAELDRLLAVVFLPTLTEREREIATLAATLALRAARKDRP